LLHDGHEYTRALLTSTANVSERYDYDAFGAMLASTGGQSVASSAKTIWLMPDGSYEAGTGWTYNLARRRDGFWWTSKDPRVASPGDPGNANLYVYVNANAPNMVDASGLFGEGLVGLLTTMGARAVLTGILSSGALGTYSWLTHGSFTEGAVAGFLGGSALVVALHEEILPEALGAAMGSAAFQIMLTFAEDVLGKNGPIHFPSFGELSQKALITGAWGLANYVYGEKLKKYVGGDQDNAWDTADTWVTLLGAAISGIQESIKVTSDPKRHWSDAELGEIVSKAVGGALVQAGIRIMFKSASLNNLPGASTVIDKYAGEMNVFTALAIRSLMGNLIGQGWARAAQNFIKWGVAHVFY
jgi:hypothetical protein